MALLKVGAPDRHRATIREVERLPWIIRPSFSVEAAYEILKDAVDPRDDTGDVPWCRALCLVHDPQVGLRLARQWFSYHHGASYDEGRDVSTSVEAVAVYSVALFELLTGRTYDAKLWYVWAGSMTEEGRLAVPLISYVRAVRLLQPVLARLRAESL